MRVAFAFGIPYSLAQILVPFPFPAVPSVIVPVVGAYIGALDVLPSWTSVAKAGGTASLHPDADDSWSDGSRNPSAAEGNLQNLRVVMAGDEGA